MQSTDISIALNNPAWSALVGRQAYCAAGNAKARWFDPQYTTLAGIAEKSLDCFAALRDGMQTRQVVVLATQPPLPAGWSDGFEVIDDFFGAQMVCDQLNEVDYRDIELVELTTHDVPQMTALVELTRPGPFGKRTIEFGKFLGITYGGTLIAMAGERMKPGEVFDEVSAVCTHPDYQGRGYARVLVHAIAKEIFERGHVPFLHVRTENVAGIKSYSNVGFRHRCDIEFIVLRKR